MIVHGRGRPPKSPGSSASQPRHTAGLADGKKLTVVPMAALHADMLRVIAHGIRTGVPARLLDGYRAYRDASALVVTNEHQARVTRLQEDARALRARAKTARRLATEETDPDVADDYRDDARDYTQQATAAEAEMRRLTEQVERQSLPAQFDGEVDYLLTGLKALLPTSDARVTLDQANALRTVMPEISLELVGREIHWSAELLLPADNRVVALGPFTGRVPARGRILTQAELDDIATASGAAQRRRQLIHQLDEAGYPRHLSRAASLAPRGLLPQVLLGQAVLWPDCPEDFDHHGFNEYLRRVWGAHPGWSASVYCQTNPSRQALADLIASLGGTASLADIEPHLVDLGIKRNDIYSMTLPKHARDPKTPPWPPTVLRTNTWATRSPSTDSYLASPRCPRCRQPVTAVVRVLEVTDALLCRTCHVMPSEPERVFPPLYLDLALPQTPISA